MSNIEQVYTTPDGQTFKTKKEAMDHLRLPKIREALKKLTNNNAELINWLIDNQDTVESAFETGTVKRVTKVERNKLRKALDAIKEDGNHKFKFVIDNLEAVFESFRWPAVKRMSADEKTIAARNTLVSYSEGDEKLADWIMSNQEAILEAYQAGVEKREVPEKTQKALADYRAKKAAEKAAAEAAAA